MKINLNQTIKNFDGREAVDENGKKITIGQIIINTLLINKADMGNAEKMDRWVLAKKVRKAKDTIDITLEEASKIKDWVTASSITIVAGQISDILEGNQEKE